MGVVLVVAAAADAVVFGAIAWALIETEEMEGGAFLLYKKRGWSETGVDG